MDFSTLDDLEIGRILHLKSETRNLKLDCGYRARVQFEISSFGFEMQDSSNFEIVQGQPSVILIRGFANYIVPPPPHCFTASILCGSPLSTSGTASSTAPITRLPSQPSSFAA